MGTWRDQFAIAVDSRLRETRFHKLEPASEQRVVVEREEVERRSNYENG